MKMYKNNSLWARRACLFRTIQLPENAYFMWRNENVECHFLCSLRLESILASNDTPLFEEGGRLANSNFSCLAFGHYPVQTNFP